MDAEDYQTAFALVAMAAKDYQTAFALVAMAEAMADTLRAAGVLPSQTRRQTRRPQRLCKRCGKQTHRTNDCTERPLDEQLVRPVAPPPPAMRAPLVPRHTGVSPDEVARLAKITPPGSRYKPRPLGVADVRAVERCRCNGETHRIALLNNGSIALLDHPRQAFRLQGWALKSAGQPLPGCWQMLQTLQRKSEANWGDDSQTMLARVRRSHRAADEKHGRVRLGVDHERGKNYEALRREHETTQHLVSAKRHMAVIQKAFQAVLEATFKSQPNVKHAPYPKLFKRLNYSNRVVSATLMFNMYRWYTHVYLKNQNNIPNVLLLDVRETDVIGRPTNVVALRKGDGSVECIHATVKYGPTGRGRLVKEASYTERSR